MRLFQVLFGLIALGSGLFLAFGSDAGFVSGRQGMGIGFGVAALVFMFVGARWIRGRASTSWRDDRATEKQKSFADDLGIQYRKDISKGELSDLISEATGE